jgi:hypothetical protein
MDGLAPFSPSRDVFSSELRVALAPEATYRRLLADEAAATWWHRLERPAIVLLVIGVIVPIMAVQRVTIGLVVTSALSWSFAVVIQILAGAVVIGSAPSRRIAMPRALDLWLAGHLPYSVWMLAVAILVANSMWGSLDSLVFSAVVPAVWTSFIVSAYCRTVLATTASGARWRVAMHQALVWSTALTYIAWASGGWRLGLLAFLVRRFAT